VFQFGYNFANTIRIELETGARKDLRILGEYSRIMANDNRASERQGKHLAWIPLRVQQARHEHVGVEHNPHLRRACRAAAISSSISGIVSSCVEF
jgi:hypothetical protein